MYSSLLLDVNQPAVTFDHPVWTETDILSKELTDSILSENFGATPDYTCNNSSSQFLFDIEDIATSTCDAAFNDTVSLSSGIDTSSRLDADSDSDQFIFQLDAEDGTRLSIYNAGSNTGPQSTNRNPLESVPDTLFTFDTFLELDLLNECLNIGNNDFDSASLSGTSEDTQKDYVEIPHSTTCTIPSPNNCNSFCWPNIDYATAKRRSLLYDKNEFQKSSSQNHSSNQERSKSSPKISPNPVQSTKHHDHQRTYRCPVLSCDKIYLKASHLRSHVRRHTGIKPFACDWNGCEWRFSRSDELARHKRSHSGIKPYACNICDKAFSRSDHLSKHAKVHMKKMALYGTPVITKKCNYKYLSLNKIDTNLL